MERSLLAEAWATPPPSSSSSSRLVVALRNARKLKKKGMGKALLKRTCLSPRAAVAREINLSPSQAANYSSQLLAQGWGLGMYITLRVGSRWTC